jgi:hypothetical protein
MERCFVLWLAGNVDRYLVSALQSTPFGDHAQSLLYADIV